MMETNRWRGTYMEAQDRIRELEAALAKEREQCGHLVVEMGAALVRAAEAESELDQVDAANTRLRLSWREDTAALRAELDEAVRLLAVSRDKDEAAFHERLAFLARVGGGK